MNQIIVVNIVGMFLDTKSLLDLSKTCTMIRNIIKRSNILCAFHISQINAYCNKQMKQNYIPLTQLEHHHYSCIKKLLSKSCCNGNNNRNVVTNCKLMCNLKQETKLRVMGLYTKKHKYRNFWVFETKEWCSFINLFEYS